MSFVQRRRLVTLVSLIIWFTRLLVICNGQPTTEDTDTNEIDDLRAVLTNSVARIAELEAEITKLKEKQKSDDSTNGKDQRGTNYIRWGRKTCESNATLVYEGYAAGPHYNEAGSGSNFLCLPQNPEWKNFIDGQQGLTGSIYGVEYELFNTGDYNPRNNIFSENNSGGPLLDKPAPCALCYVQGRSTVAMVPARTQCPDGWTTEYAGYMVSEVAGQRYRSNYICWDEAPEVAVGGTNQDQAVIYPVEVECGSLPCSVYTSGRELTCVVCSK